MTKIPQNLLPVRGILLKDVDTTTSILIQIKTDDSYEKKSTVNDNTAINLHNNP